MNEHGQRGFGAEFKNNVSYTVLFLQTGAVSLEVFLHSRFGERYLGLQAALAVLLIILFQSVIYPEAENAPMHAFLPAYLIMCVVARIGMFWRRWFGKELVHSQYTGKPHLSRIFKKISEATIKKIEPVLVFILGWAVPGGLGAYLMLSSVCLLFSVLISLAHDRQRILDLRDSSLDQLDIAEKFRNDRHRM